MPNRLTDLKVPRVSFVSRAAVRDPANPTEPRRFVFTKADDTDRKDPPMAAATTNLSDALRRAMSDHADELKDGDISPRIAQIADLADSRRGKPVDAANEDVADPERALAKQLTALAKAASSVPLSRQGQLEVAKASSASQLAYLRQRSPRAAEQWERTHPAAVGAAA
jgi:hypothetical protein